MNKPTKTQLANAVTYYESALKPLADLPDGDYVFVEHLRDILRNAPSLEPQPKVVVVVEESSSEAAADA